MTKVPLNESDATAISFPDWMRRRGELDSEWTGNADARLTENFGFQVLVYALFGLDCENSHHHEMWMCAFPGNCLFFALEKPVDDDRVALSRSPA